MSTGNFTHHLRDLLLDEVFGGVAYAPETNLYIALSTTLPDDVGANFTEPAEVDGYDRVTVPNDLVNWVASANGEKFNAEDFTFPEATGSWGEITHFGIYDADLTTGGNLLAWGELAVAKTVGAGDTATFNAGDVEITLSACVTT